MAQTTIAFVNLHWATVEAVLHILALVSALALVIFGIVMAILRQSQEIDNLSILLILGVGVNLLIFIGTWHVRLRNRQNTAQLGDEEIGCVSAVWASCNYEELRSGTPEFSQFRIQRGQPPATTIQIIASGDAPSVPDRKIAFMRDDDACYCCLDGFDPQCQVALLPCGHVFHETCIATWCLCNTPNANTCPVCRGKYDLSDKTAAFALP